MSETLFDPTIHQSAEPLLGYRFEHEVLVARLNELKKAPTKDMKSFLDAHPEYKAFNCSALAEYSGLSEPTLKKLKSGQIADPRGSTFWILFNKFGIRPREVLKCIPPDVCNVECANQAKLKLAEIMQNMEKLETQHAADQAELGRLRKLVLEKGEALAAAQANVAHLQSLVDGNAAHKVQSSCEERRDRRRLRIALIVVCVVTIVSLTLAMYFLWEAMHPYAGNFRVK